MNCSSPGRFRELRKAETLDTCRAGHRGRPGDRAGVERTVAWRPRVRHRSMTATLRLRNAPKGTAVYRSASGARRPTCRRPARSQKVIRGRRDRNALGRSARPRMLGARWQLVPYNESDAGSHLARLQVVPNGVSPKQHDTRRCRARFSVACTLPARSAHDEAI